VVKELEEHQQKVAANQKSTVRHKGLSLYEICTLCSEFSAVLKQNRDVLSKMAEKDIEELVYHLILRFIMYFEHDKANVNIVEIENLINLFIEIHSNSKQMFVNLLQRFLQNAETLNISHQFIFRKLF